MAQCLKNRSVHDQLGKRGVDQNWADYEKESNEEEYVWQEGQWCLGGLTRCQKIRVQCLRNRELEAQKSCRPRAWRVKQTTNKAKPSTNVDMVFLLPVEFKAPSKYDEEEYDEEEFDEAVAQLTL